MIHGTVIKGLRFRHHNASLPVPKTNQKMHVTSEFIDFNGPQDGTQTCNHREILPPIPEPSPDLLRALEILRKLHHSCLSKQKRKRKPQQRIPKVSRMNGFTAFKSFYSCNLSAVGQGTLSSVLSKVWTIDKNQHVWDLYANLFRRYKRSETFPEWLVKNSIQSKEKVFMDSNILNVNELNLPNKSDEVFKILSNVSSSLEQNYEAFPNQQSNEKPKTTVDSTPSCLVSSSSSPLVSIPACTPNYEFTDYFSTSSDIHSNIDYLSIESSNLFPDLSGVSLDSRLFETTDLYLGGLLTDVNFSSQPELIQKDNISIPSSFDIINFSDEKFWTDIPEIDRIPGSIFSQC